MRVFVLGGYLPNGGTYMAYLLGKILYEEFALEVIVVTVAEEAIENDNTRYDYKFDSISFDQLKGAMTAKDLLIANPSYSKYLLGLQCPGRKLMYVQGMNTFNILDGFFDRYVSVSRFVANFLDNVYKIETTVIPACIMVDQMPTPIPWEEKSDAILVPVIKESGHITLLVESFFKKYAERYQDIRPKCVVVGKKTPQSDFWDLINQHRYHLTLSPIEGFGLVPLEAMALGCTVMGFDGMGGSQYMQDRVNCSVSGFADLDSVVEKTHQVISCSNTAKDLAIAGAATARSYDFLTFKESWRPVLQSVIS